MTHLNATEKNILAFIQARSHLRKTDPEWDKMAEMMTDFLATISSLRGEVRKTSESLVQMGQLYRAKYEAYCSCAIARDNLELLVRRLRDHIEINTIPYVKKDNHFTAEECIKSGNEAAKSWLTFIDTALKENK